MMKGNHWRPFSWKEQNFSAGLVNVELCLCIGTLLIMDHFQYTDYEIALQELVVVLR